MRGRKPSVSAQRLQFRLGACESATTSNANRSNVRSGQLLSALAQRRGTTMLGLILLILLILLLAGSVPTWPHSRGWGYGPSGVLGLLLVVLILMMFLTPLFPHPWT